MAKEVIRQDVIEIKFDTDLKSLDRIERGLARLYEGVKEGQGDFGKLRNSVEDADDTIDRLSRKNLPNLKKGLSNVKDEAADVDKKVRGLDDSVGGFKESIATKSGGLDKTIFGAVSTGLATVGVAAGAGVVIGNINDMSKAMNDFRAQTGSNASEMQQYSENMKEVYNSGMGDSWGDVAETFALIKANMKLADDEIKDTAKDALLMRDTFGFDVTESTRAAQMMMNQFGISGEEAYNLIAQGAQSGLDKNGDMLDTLNEYSVHFKQLGFDAEDMLNMLVNGAADGTFSVDKLGDSVKEFGIRVIDQSDTTKQAFQAIGLDNDVISRKFAEGGESAREAFNQTIKGLQEMKDPIAQNTAGVNLFGTMWEDLGKEGIFALADINGDISTTSTALDDINAIKYDDAGSALESLGRTINTSLAGAVGDAVNYARGYINDFMAGFNGENGGALFAQLGEGLKLGIDKAKLALQDFKAGLTGQDSGTFFSNLGIAAEKVGTIISKVSGFLIEHEDITKKLIVAYGAYKAITAGVNTVLEVKSKVEDGLNKISKIKSKLTKAATTATLGETAATTAQATVTGTATVAQTGLNLAMKACPIVAIISGVVALAAGIKPLIRLVTGYSDSLEENSEKISNNIANMTDFKTAIDNCQPSLANFDSLLSDNGNTLSDIDSSISETETAITDILSDALANQSSLRADDLEDLRNYISQLKAFEAEKLGIYQQQQQSVVSETQFRINSGNFTTEDMTKAVANSQEAMDNTISAISTNLENQKTNILNQHKAGVAGYATEEEYLNEIAWVEKQAEEQMQAARDKHNEVLAMIEQNNLDIVAKSNSLYEQLSETGRIWKSQDDSILGFFDKDQSTTTYMDMLSGLSTESLNAANTLLQSAAMIKENGGVLNEETQTQINTMLSAFENVPDDCADVAKDTVLGMIGDMADQIPALSNTAEMSAEEIVSTVENYFEINSSSSSKKMMTIGENVSQGMIEGIESESNLKRINTSGQNLVNGLINGIKSKEGAALNEVKVFAAAINGEFDNAQGINSPSKVWAEKGRFLVRGLNTGLEKESGSYVKQSLLPAYTEGSTTVSRSTSKQNVTYSSPINITVNGGDGSGRTARSIKNAVMAGLREMMTSFEGSNKPVREY